MTVSLKRAARDTLVALATLSALTIPGSASAAVNDASQGTRAATASDEFTVEVVVANGTGCKPGTAKVIMSPDHTYFRIRYTDFVAESGGSSLPVEFRKNCQLGLLVHIPQGLTFAIGEADHYGRANLKKDASALLRMGLYFQGSSDTDYIDHPIAGPLHGGFTTSDIFPVLTWAPCAEQRILMVNTELRVHSGASNGYNSISLNFSEGSVDTLFHLSWKKC